MHTFHFADVAVVLVFLDLDDCFRFVIDFRANMPTGIFIAFVLMKNGIGGKTKSTTSYLMGETA